MDQQGSQSEGKTISFTLNRDKVVNAVLAVQLGLLLVFGWQIYGIKSQLNGSGSANAANGGGAKVAAAPTPSPSAAGQPTAGTVSAPTEDDHLRGNPSAKITLIEYSDFECPFCARFHPTAQEAVDSYGDDVNWVYRHFPLSFHLTAEPKAVASECVASLAGNDTFWEFADTLFADTSIQTAKLADVAESVGVNRAAFQECLDNNEFLADVQADLASGQEAGVTGTPGTIVYNNETGESSLVPGALPLSQLSATIDSLL
jgi:protein-disulfide isomerase